ncbi:MAG: tRNA pseudouridine(38-40) synthase TruA [Candidatus Caldarchaeum sp.]
MRNIKLTIEYDGTNYLGWQRQPRGRSIQQAIEEALAKIIGESPSLIGSGRTDAGVHALGQVANFFTSSLLSPSRLQMALNSLLPEDIVIVHAEEVAVDFHAQFCAVSKTYIYRIPNRPYPPALDRLRVWHVVPPLDVGTMGRCAELFLGTHDFKAFALSGRTPKTTVREVKRIEVEKQEGGSIVVEVEADGFLRGMVRLMVGALVGAGRGIISDEDIERLLKTGSRTHLVRKAPSHGLYLKEVNYG